MRKAPDGSQMTEAEFQLKQLIIAERTERFKAVNEVWDKVGKLEMQMKGLGRGNVRPGSPAHNGNAASSGHAANSSTGMLTELQADAKDMKLRMERGIANMEGEHNNLRMLLQGMQLQITELKAERKDAVPLSAAKDGNVGKALSSLTAKVEALEKRDRQQSEDLANVHELATRTHEMMPLQAVQASRVALTAVGLSESERQRALESLNLTESRVRDFVGSPPGAARTESPVSTMASRVKNTLVGKSRPGPPGDHGSDEECMQI